MRVKLLVRISLATIPSFFANKWNTRVKTRATNTSPRITFPNVADTCSSFYIAASIPESAGSPRIGGSPNFQACQPDWISIVVVVDVVFSAVVVDGRGRSFLAIWGNWVILPRMASSLSIFPRNVPLPSLLSPLSTFRFRWISYLVPLGCGTLGTESNGKNQITESVKLILIDSPPTMIRWTLTNFNCDVVSFEMIARNDEACCGR